MVIADNAGWHRAHALVVPPSVRPRFPPPCTPERQPAERLWPLAREAVAHDTFETRADSRRRVARRGRWLADGQIAVQRPTGFHRAVNPEA